MQGVFHHPQLAPLVGKDGRMKRVSAQRAKLHRMFDEFAEGELPCPICGAETGGFNVDPGDRFAMRFLHFPRDHVTGRLAGTTECVADLTTDKTLATKTIRVSKLIETSKLVRALSGT
jgi:hypothetical protein